MLDQSWKSLVTNRIFSWLEIEQNTLLILFFFFFFALSETWFRNVEREYKVMKLEFKLVSFVNLIEVAWLALLGFLICEIVYRLNKTIYYSQFDTVDRRGIKCGQFKNFCKIDIWKFVHSLKMLIIRWINDREEYLWLILWYVINQNKKKKNRLNILIF